MNVTLSPELERRVRASIERGDYENVDALVQEAISRLIEDDEGSLASLRRKLRDADAEVDRGDGVEFDEHTTVDLARQIHERGKRRLAELQRTVKTE